MDAYNELKIKTLSAFAEYGGAWVRPMEIARKLDFRHLRSAWSYLNHLQRLGLLKRRFLGKGTLRYRISQKGEARLRWLRSQED
jgi:DNA-binding IclR family transcriptional regulator